MSTEQVTTTGDTAQPGPVVWAAPRTQPPSGPAPKGPRSRWSVGKMVAAGAVAVVVAIGAGVGVSHLSSSSASTTQGPGGAGGQGGPGGQGGGFGGQGGAGSIHSDAVVSDGNGGYTTRRTQTGTVTAISGTSIAVKSVDGFTSTYVVNSSTTVDGSTGSVTTIASGATVTVIGTVSGDTATATSVLSGTAAANGAGGGGGPGGTGGGQAPGQGTTTN
jgi:hypothetical protein